MMLRVLILMLAILPGLARAQGADEQTYAEIRAELEMLSGQIQSLRNELITATPAETGVANAGPLMVRVDQIEAELRDLTGQVERLGFRIDAVVADGTNRVGDLEFRLTELEGGDFSTLGETRPLGEGQPTATAPEAPLALPGQGTEIAGLGTAGADVRPKPRPGSSGVSEPVTDTVAVTAATPVETATAAPAGAGFDAALTAYREGRYTDAITGFDAYIGAEPGGARVSEAAYWRGEALAAQGSWNLAARSYLDAFSGAPEGPKAPESLLRLGVSLGRLGQFNEACLTLGEVGKRFPQAGGDIADRTASEMRALNCS